MLRPAGAEAQRRAPPEEEAADPQAEEHRRQAGAHSQAAVVDTAHSAHTFGPMDPNGIQAGKDMAQHTPST